MNNTFAYSAFTALCEVINEWPNELRQYIASQLIDSSDDEQDSKQPITMLFFAL